MSGLVPPLDLNVGRGVFDAHGVWIAFVTAISPRASTLIPKVTGSIYPSEEVVKEEDEGEAFVFGKDLEISRGAVERFSAEIVFWRKPFAYCAKQTLLGKGADYYGFDLPKGLKEYLPKP